MATFRKEEDRSSVGADSPVDTKKQVDGESLGTPDSSVQARLDQDAVMYRAGYDYAYDVFMPRILELEDQLRYYIKHSVAQMFQDIGYDGAHKSRQRSTQRFWNEYHQERDAA